MGRSSISDWSWRMEQHRKKGHKIIMYPEPSREKPPAKQEEAAPEENKEEIKR